MTTTTTIYIQIAERRNRGQEKITSRSSIAIDWWCVCAWKRFVLWAAWIMDYGFCMSLSFDESRKKDTRTREKAKDDREKGTKLARQMALCIRWMVPTIKPEKGAYLKRRNFRFFLLSMSLSSVLYRGQLWIELNTFSPNGMAVEHGTLCYRDRHRAAETFRSWWHFSRLYGASTSSVCWVINSNWEKFECIVSDWSKWSIRFTVTSGGTRWCGYLIFHRSRICNGTTALHIQLYPHRPIRELITYGDLLGLSCVCMPLYVVCVCVCVA